MAKTISGSNKFEPNSGIPVGSIPQAGNVPPDNQWDSNEGLADNEDSRPPQAIPAEGQETHDGFSGFIPQEKFANQGSLPHKEK